ncbi:MULTISPECIES: bifunctional folylpolyglutamate synthase/dihydrofolate synthase [Bacillus]|uniref:bifunctional folylpolyglutamate synthase/dihydrofolate synthase n=1 Tax=Bacillus TaxID=1386 RepID=UPI0002F18049|nr:MULTISPECIES: folylpolyglutamate synthase/dihydrofolate synthase family protein [Bacillus]
MLQKIEDMYDYFAKREQRFGMNFGLERMDALLEGLHIQHNQQKFIHLAGTNGKGSTLHYLKKILSSQGYRVGTFTSPHIESIKERIMINDEYIEEEDFLRLFNTVVQYVESMEQENVFPTQFEILTIIALMYFQEKKPDYVLMETGLGGRLDSTNVIHSLISIITNISLDHTNILGNKISGIAAEKAGIIKEDSIVITGVKDEEALPVIKAKASEMNSEILVINENFYVESKMPTQNGEVFHYCFGNHTFEDCMISMLGKHQIDNASLAITAALVLRDKYNVTLTNEAIRTGLLAANWKGRLETISETPKIIVDGSHNEAGISALIDTLKARYRDKKIIIVTAALADKDVDSMISMLEEVADHMICTQFEMDRALEAEKLATHCKNVPCSIEMSWEKALEKSLEMVDDDSLIVVTGSLYFLYYARPYLMKY